MLGFFGFFLFVIFFKKKKVQVKQEKLIPTTQENLPIKDIKDGIVYLKTGGYRVVLELPSINIDLMEASEREGILGQYRMILNSFDFPFQYLQQSRIVDISDYLETIENLKLQSKTNFLSSQLGFYSDFLKDLIRNRSVLTKKFFIVIPYDPEREKKHSKRNQYHSFDRNRKQIEAQRKQLEEDKEYMERAEFEKAKAQLDSRAALVLSAFRRFDINALKLNDEELRHLYYTCYNKDRSVYQTLKDTHMKDYTTLRVQADINDLEVEIGE